MHIYPIYSGSLSEGCLARSTRCCPQWCLYSADRKMQPYCFLQSFHFEVCVVMSEKNSLRLYAFGASNIFILPMEKLTNINAKAVLQPRFQLQASDSAARSMFKSIHFCEGTNQTCKHTTATIHKLGRRFTIRQQKKKTQSLYTTPSLIISSSFSPIISQI